MKIFKGVMRKGEELKICTNSYSEKFFNRHLITTSR